MWVAFACFALLALAGLVAFLSRCPVMIQTTRERETTERVVHGVTPPAQVHHVHHVHHVETTVPHAQVVPAASMRTAGQGPTCPCGCGLPLSQVQGTPALGPAPDAVAAVGRVVPALERRQR